MAAKAYTAQNQQIQNRTTSRFMSDPGSPALKPRKKPSNPGGLSRAGRRRRQLGEVVMQLIQERGFDAVSVSRVAESASISVGGLYRHIKTKSDLLEIVCDEINLGLRERMAEAAAGCQGISAKLKAAITVYWETCWNTAPALLVAVREWQSLPKDAQKRYIAQESHIAEYLADLIRAGVVSDEFRAVDERLMAHEILLLAQMKAFKGWTLQGRLGAAVLEEHLELIFSRLRHA